jgi:2-keto-4-pentenoate hydratase/2-oxohepta-3-ene-1,7-dioic acid hydratase in catechol pathway
LFKIPTLISFISQAMTLEAGDVIITGTPSGVSAIQPGDVVEVEIERLGVLRNPVVADS